MHIVHVRKRFLMIFPHQRKVYSDGIIYDANLLFGYTTGKSANGIIHLYNKTPTDWYSSKIILLECATYSIEYTSMKIAVEQIIANCNKSLYLGCHKDGPTHLFGDNKCVIDTSMYPSYC
jgi:hypothetical protein